MAGSEESVAILPRMPKQLVIVESPAKARTIERYLGDDYRVLASYGHVRDLPDNPGKGKFGVDVEHGFTPEYVISEDRRKQVDAIEKAAKSADVVYLATDLDREGEAIAGNVPEAAHVAPSKTRRVTFSEITERAIREAFANPRDIDVNLVDAQQARRIVDRLVGYTLSPLLSKKVRGGVSAGRVQSVAVRLVVEREREVEGFVAREYWTLKAVLETAAGESFEAEVARIGGEPIDVTNAAAAEHHAETLRVLRPRVTSIAVKRQKRSPAPPFTTSTLQQEASRKLGFSPKRTMSVAQHLYEGVETPDGHVGLITYMRTDSWAMAGVAMGEAREAWALDVEPAQHFTEPPPRYTEASLIKALEEHGIGRPSTYAATISTIVDRGYVRVEERRLRPEPVANIVTDLLVDHFGDYVDVEFTARMEEDLDEVAAARRAWGPLLEAFYGPLKDRVDVKRRELKRADFTTEPSDEVCSEGHPMVVRLGRNGRFLACSLFPEHRESRPLPGDEPPPQEGVGETCPQCGLGTLVGKRGRFGPFVGCDRYPECEFIKREGPAAPTPLAFEVTCPKNGDGHLVARRARRTGNVFWGCSAYPRCDYTTNHEPIGSLHDADSGPVARRADGSTICLKCGAAIEVPADGPVAGALLPGGPPDPAALLSPRASGRRGGRRPARHARSPH